MSTGDFLDCGVARRRARLFGNPDWNGIDFVEVADDQRSLCVHFFGRVPDRVGLDNIQIEGGRRIRGIRAVALAVERSDDPELDDCLRIVLDRAGDFSEYRLCLVEAGGQGAPGVPRPLAGMDPRYACASFSFKLNCPSELDCKPEPVCAPQPPEAPDINYLAKDYASFRQLIYDRLALTMPDWHERHVPDLGVTLVELLAYAADHLSYYQDAVATEAYLDTARRRISVRRHLRLIDYRMHEGCNARAWVTVSTTEDLAPLAARDFYFITGFPGIRPASGGVLFQAELEGVAEVSYLVFEPLVADPAAQFVFRAAHSTIQLYTWGDEECCLAQGATAATLLDQTGAPAMDGAPGARVLALHPGDVLVFEEVLGPVTGIAADADPTHRHAVRLTRVTQAVDALFGVPVLEIEWDADDALPFPLCLSVRLGPPGCERKGGVSVARGNVVLVDHGRSAGHTLGPVPGVPVAGECACEGSVLDSSIRPGRFAPALDQTPLSFAQPLPTASAAGVSARSLLAQDPRLAVPLVMLEESAGPIWEPRHDLLAGNPEDNHFVAEIDDDGRARLRFGDGAQGRMPPAGAIFRARYRIGNGLEGNVGADTINYLVLRSTALGATRILPRNPMAAVGGTAPQPMDEARLLAPGGLRTRRERAITPQDYAELAQRDRRVSRAAAQLRWMGSWYEMRVALDPFGTAGAVPGLERDVAAALAKVRRIGHDLAVGPARYVSIALVLEVCVLPHYHRAAVRSGLLHVLGGQRRPDGRPALFHPDNLSFGDGVHVSRVIAAARRVPGVEAVRPLRLARQGVETGAPVPASGELPMSPFEIARLDNDPDWPENGTLTLILRGGV